MSTSYLNSAGIALASSGAATRGTIAASKAYLAGTSGNDALRTGGSSTLAGGDGDDTYYVYTTSDIVIEKLGQGIDTIISSAPGYILPAHVENLSILADRAYGKGNALDNIIKGGGTGSQTLDGGAGNDVLIAGAGPDTFVVTKGEGSDVVYGFKATTDLIQLNSYSSLSSFAKVKAAMTQVGADIVLALGGGETLTLKDHKASDLTAANFRLSLDMSDAKLSFNEDFNSFSGSATGKGTTWMTALPYSGISARTLGSNHEAQYYSDSSVGVNPFSIQNGILDITAAHATPGIETPAGSGLSWTSGMITTYKSFAQLYGYFEVKAQLPSGAGFWPAFWLLPADNTWPPELDIFEVLGKDPSTLYATTHSKVGGPNVTKGNAVLTDDLSKAFHTYGVDWQADTITWYLDGNVIAKAATPVDMHKPMYMLLNLAVGDVGSWPGPTDASTPAEGHMLVDYVRAYTKPAFVEPDVPVVTGPTSLALAGLAAGSLGGASATVTGTTAAGAKISLYDGKTLVATVTADAATGAFSVPIGKLDAGIHVLTAQVGDVVVGNGLTVAVGTAADIVAKLPALQASTGLSGIYLTDTHVLTVDSAATMQSLLTKYGTALATIQGGFTFAVATASGGTTTVASYTAGGTLVDTTVSTMAGGLLASKTITKTDGSSIAYGYKDGIVTSETQIHADKTKDVYLSGITGATYVQEHATYNASNTLISSIRTHADGTKDYKFSFDASTGVKVTETYTAAGQLAMRTTFTATKDTVQQKYEGGVISSEYTYYAAGSDDIAALKSYTNGTLTRMNVRNSDQSSDAFTYNITGKAHTAEHNALDASGKVKFVDLTMKDGSHQITAGQAHQTMTSTTQASDTFKGLGSDTFVFHKDFGADQILGFHSGSGAGHDVIQIDRTMAADKAELSIASVGLDTLIHVTEFDSILLKGVAAASLTKDNFLFM